MRRFDSNSQVVLEFEEKDEIQKKAREVAGLTAFMLEELLLQGKAARDSKMLEECEELADEVQALAMQY